MSAKASAAFTLNFRGFPRFILFKSFKSLAKNKLIDGL